ncbi:Por secretion system C-terminal sorting domain-containing protein [Tenacibaculum sp. MAR_2009_124]|uniref:fibronectin type III domain-containing protein n=1 Tax=Tenacibaculum sp. MAR_2009_124 TaxID=1250059 RepID=UPI00089A1463|nr:agmatine deiminase family protein [Tenacibaculum sp. MAR_2009_124]SEC87072.1 Por secretion system C-terminal sorting domain-containing protein [Tenacibaculum sp. MAR_2009_124]
MRKVKLTLVLLTIIFTNLMYAQEGMTPREKKLIIEKYKKNNKNHQFKKSELDVIYNYLKNQDTKTIDEACTENNKRAFKKESKQEKKRNSAQNNTLNASPISLPTNAKFPGEFEEIQGVFVCYPYEDNALMLSEFSNGDPSYSKFFRELIDGIQEAGVKVYINVRSQADTTLLIRHFQDKGTPLYNYDFLINPTDSFWTRDFGPINFYYGANDEIGWVDLNYGGRRKDDALTPIWAEHFDISHTYMPLLFEGGNTIMNGYQSLTTSDKIYTNNSEHSKAYIDETFKSAFNLNDLHVLEALKYDGWTGHVDLYIDMINENRYVYTKQPAEMGNIPDYTDYQTILDNVAYLSTQESPGGVNKPYLFDTVPFPTKDDGSQYDDPWDIHWSSRTFSNHLIINKTIIQPVFNNGQTGDIAGDQAALEIIRKSYPGYKIIPIDSRALIGTGGSIHCVTKEFHAENPVRFKHYPYYGKIDNCQSNYTVDVVVTNKSGINKASLFSRIKGSSSWNLTNMIKGENNHWTADITTSSGSNQVMEYYISATSNNNKTMIHPMTGDQGGAFTFWCTSQTDTEAPTAPTNLTASNITQTTVDLSWTSSTDNIEVTGYEIYQGSTLIASTSSGTTHLVTGLTANTSYIFYVKAKDAAGNISVSSNEINVTTLADTTNPNDCSNIPNYQGSANYSNGDRIVYQNQVYERINNQWVYQFDCDATPADTQAPTAPSDLTALNITQTSADLTWNPSTDNVAVTEYEVYQENTLIGSTSSLTSFSVSNLTENTTYSFSVYAKDAAGNTSIVSNIVTVKTLANTTNPNDCANIPSYQDGVAYNNGDRIVYNNKVYEMINGQWAHQFDCNSIPADTEAPSTPSNLTYENVTETSVDLNWTESTDNIAVVAYDIYQGSSLIGSTSPTTTFNVSDLTENTTYSFFVQARDEEGNTSSSSNVISVETLTTVTNPNDCSLIPNYQNGVAYNNGDRIVYNNKVYEMANGQWSFLFDCNTTADTQAPTAPSNLSAYNITETTLELSWNVSNDNVLVTAYDIYQGNTLIGRTSLGTSTVFNVTNLTENTSYSYTVYAKDEAGNVSSASNTITVTTISAADPNDCSNIPNYQNNVAYSNGDRIVYYSQAYEMINGQWTYLFDCSSSYRISAAETTSKTIVYPNPVESNFSITSDISIKGATYVIFDGNGRKLKTGQYESNINVQELNLISGTTYYIKFYLNDGVIEKKFIKK